MLRAGTSGPNPLVLAGLTEENILRLKNGQPISAPLGDFSPGMPGRLAIIYGRTHGDLERTMEDAGVLSDDIDRRSDPRVDRYEAILRDHKHVLICTVGLPRSGKSTWARKQAYPVVNPDSIRLAIHGQRFVATAEPFVWATAKVMVRSLFLAGHQTVILDATNVTKKRRMEWFDAEWATLFKTINTPKEECVTRARAEGDEEIVPVIERMDSDYEPLDDSCLRWD